MIGLHQVMNRRKIQRKNFQTLLWNIQFWIYWSIVSSLHISLAENIFIYNIYQLPHLSIRIIIVTWRTYSLILWPILAFQDVHQLDSVYDHSLAHFFIDGNERGSLPRIDIISVFVSVPIKDIKPKYGSPIFSIIKCIFNVLKLKSVTNKI